MFAAVILVLCLFCSPVHAWMWEVGDEALAEITGEGYSSFTLENNVARAYFNITAATYTEIDSLKMGYYNNGITGLGWDENWEGVSLGSPTESLVCKGLYIEAGFSNMADPATRQLDFVRVGTPSMTGPISANFISFSGHIENPIDGVLVDGRRLNLGMRTIYSTDSEFSVTLDRNSGWWFHWGNATITP
ncbi:MAG: hypothetical protein ACOX3E_00055 [Desulfomonilia bacterium]|nr:hypothetical protein [Deltaproteobacteria bacterium]